MPSGPSPTTRREFLRLAACASLAAPIRSRAWSADPQSDAARLRALRARPKAAQEKAIEDLRRVLESDDDPWQQAVFAAIARGRALAVGKDPAGWQNHKGRDEGEWRYAALPFALRHEYLWGHRVVRAIEKRPSLRVGEGREQLTLEPGSPAEWFLAPIRGLLPDLDLAIAGIQHELDTERGADRFQSFLESWRNGDESFYVALDRTAGTDKAVFFFDAMLAEFAHLFADEAKRDHELERSLKRKHDALVDAFLAYRQYRALREAASFALVMPGSVRLPAHLARYETAAGGYSFRDDLAILLQLSAGSLPEVVATVAAATPPLPQPLWSTSGRYEGIESFQQGLKKRIDDALSDDASTDGWRDAWNARMSATSERIRAHAIAVLDA